MKTTYRIYFTTLILIMALSACTKEATPGKVDTDPVAGALRTIAVSFDTQNQTRTVLNGLKPTFEEDKDTVLVAQNSGLVEPEKCTVRKVGDKYIIQTTIPGQIQMVYPHTRAKVVKNAIIGVTVPSTQTGKFADANICMTDPIDQNTTTAVFKNKVAILKFYADESIGVESITIQSEKPLISDGETETKIIVQPSGAQGKANATQHNPPLDSRILYAAIYTGDKVNAKNLTFTSVTTSQDEDVIKTSTSDVYLSNGTMYNAFIPYYIKVKVSDEPEKYQRWAYCNVGAFLPEEPGLYFAWGDTKGYKWDAEKEQFEDGHSFTWANCPFNGGSEDFSSTAFEAAKATAFPSGTLVLGCDAANVNWGDKWRIPTSEEFGYVIDNAVHVDGGGISLGNHLFFPAAGSGEGAELTRFGQGSDYWSNTVYTSGDDMAFALEFCSFLDEEEGEVQRIYKGYPSRKIGFPIRPIYDPDLSENEQLTLTITAYPDNGTF